MKLIPKFTLILLIFIFSYLNFLPTSQGMEDSGSFVITNEKKSRSLEKKSSNEIESIPAQTFTGDYKTIFKLVLQEMDKYELQTVDPVNGLIRTAWIDNTKENSFFDTEKIYPASRFYLLINVHPTASNFSPSTTVTIFKKQQIMELRNSNLPEKWKNIISDGSMEKNIFSHLQESLNSWTVLPPSPTASSQLISTSKSTAFRNIAKQKIKKHPSPNNKLRKKYWGHRKKTSKLRKKSSALKKPKKMAP